jgi:integrase
MVTRKGNKWYIVKWVNGKRKWISTGKDNRAEAELLEQSMSLMKDGKIAKFYKIITAIYGEEESPERITLESLIVEYPVMAKSLGIKIADETMRKRKNAVGRLSVWCNDNTESIKYADELTVPLAWKFIESMTGANVNTQRKVAGELSAVWEALQKRGLVLDNPWRSAKPQKDSSLQKHGRAFTMEEVKNILAACCEDWQRHTVMIGLYTGLRLGDVFRLKWENIDFEGSMIRRFKPSKTARHDIEVCLPLHHSLSSYLSRFRASHGNIVNAPCSANRFGEIYFTKIIAKAGLIAGEKVKLSYHCLRHTFATMLASTGATEQERMRLGGWSSAKTAEIYNHDDSRARIIVDSLPSI